MLRRGFLVLAVHALLAGCAGLEEDAGTGASATRRISPSAGLGRIEITKPSWFDDRFASRFLVHPAAALQPSGVGFPALPAPVADLSAGESRELAPGDYVLHVVPQGLVERSPSGLVALEGGRMRVVAGETATFVPAGVAYVPDRPIVWSGNAGFLAGVETSSGAGVFVRNGRIYEAGDRDLIRILNLTYPSTLASVLVARPGATFRTTTGEFFGLQAGELKSFAVKTKTIAVDLDPVNPGFPDDERNTPKLVAGETSTGYSEPVRRLASFQTAVLPESAPLRLDVFGLPFRGRLEGGVERFKLHRVEIDGALVGGARVRGTVQVDIKAQDGAWFPLVRETAQLWTGTGIDLPDGTYRFTTRAQTPGGPVSSVDEVTLP